MKRISKILVVGLTMASFGVVISGCGGGDKASSGAPEAGPEEAANQNESAANVSTGDADDSLVDTAARLASESLDGEESVEIVESEAPEVEDSGAISVDADADVVVGDQTAAARVAPEDERISVGGAASATAPEKSRAEELLERAEEYAHENKDYKVVTTLRKVDESELDASQLRKKNSMYQKASKALASSEKGLVVE